MNTIVFNTLTGAVTEYDGFAFDSITPSHAGSAQGLFELGGNDDAGAAIVGSVETGKTLWTDLRRKLIDAVFVAIQSTGQLVFAVKTARAVYNYPLTPRTDRVSKVTVGRGIRDNYLSFQVTNPKGQDFRLDAIDLLNAASARRRT